MLVNLGSKLTTSSKHKSLSKYKISHSQPKPQVNLTRIHAQPGLEIWTDNPKSITVKPYQGPPINLKNLGKMGNVIVLPPGNWQINPNGKVTQFAFPFPSPLGQNPPGQIVQHFTGHPQAAAQPKPAAPVASAYKNHGLRTLINQSRVSERFHDVQGTSDKLKQKAASVIDAFQKGTSRHSQANANLKSQHLVQIASVLDQHKSEQAKFMPTTTAEIKAQAKSQIDSLEQGMQAIAEITHSGRAHYSKDNFKALQTLSREMDAERALLVQVMDDPKSFELGSKLSWGEATELKRLGYASNPDLADEFTTLTDADLVKPDEHFGAGKKHSVQKLTFAGETVNDPPREYLFKAEDARDTSRYERVVGKDKYLDKSRPRFAARNLAARKLQNTLDLKLLPDMKLTTHNGKMGLLMTEARGVQPFNHDTGKPEDIAYDSLEKPRVSANIQKNLTDAQWLDCLTGQQDRHSTNLFIDPDNGDVTLIDNDQAFYPGLREVNDPEPDHKVGNWPPPWPGKPELISRETFEKITTMDEDSLRRDLEPLLDKKEIDSTLFRLNDLKQHAKKLADEGKVVEDWLTWRSPETEGGKGGLRVADFLRSTGKPQSYFNALSEQAEQLHTRPDPQHTRSL
ncbi:hypothetical protein EZMO1_4414 [Endozoicomonas montiporae CL-33]|nr:hypothetical protein EZMO1_4414 [Endozoicomonas montiporae CL-33]